MNKPTQAALMRVAKYLGFRPAKINDDCIATNTDQYNLQQCLVIIENELEHKIRSDLHSALISGNNINNIHLRALSLRQDMLCVKMHFTQNAKTGSAI